VEGAEKFLAFMVSDAGVQADWANAQGALSANVNVDPKSYNAVMQKAAATVAAAEAFAFNYDLATPPPVAEVGLSMFTRFIDDPSQAEAILTQVATDAEAAFKQ
jgi:multiple sugar transport system substrate-binding protein/raffinose/stachyose/melibiose transport system substrate-binding protein